MITVDLFSGQGCHLCDDARAILADVRREIPFALREHSIDGDPLLEARYRSEIPVVEIDGHKLFKFKVQADSLRRALRARGDSGS